MNPGSLAFDMVSWSIATTVGGWLILASYLAGRLGRRGWRPRALSVVHALLVTYAVCLTWVSVLLLVQGPAVADSARVWLGLGLGGAIGLIVLARNRPGRWRDARQAEERRIAALDL